jgi:hypothetical protein
LTTARRAFRRRRLPLCPYATVPRCGGPLADRSRLADREEDGGTRGGGPDTAAAGREEAQGDGEEGAAQRVGDPAALRRRQGGLPLPVQPPRARGTHQRLR